MCQWDVKHNRPSTNRPKGGRSSIEDCTSVILSSASCMSCSSAPCWFWASANFSRSFTISPSCSSRSFVKSSFIFSSSLTLKIKIYFFYISLLSNAYCWWYLCLCCGASMLHWLCNGLPRDGLGFDSWWEQCINQASCPWQGTVNRGGVSKWPRCQWDAKQIQPTN